MSLFKKRDREAIQYDPNTQQPAVRKSICTGEMTAGFIDRETGRFRDIMRLDGQKDLEAFCRSVGVSVEEIKTIY
ncbi:MAG: aspartate dehydrogenase [Clostridia bacterium]|nr:aspartate dehydrogenase [Clostridia bacterium]